MPKRINYGTQSFALRRPNIQENQNMISPKTIQKLNANQGYINILNQIVKDLNTKPHKYTREQVIQWIQNPSACEKQIRELNIYLRYISNQFNRALDYFSNILTFDYVIVPINAYEEDMAQNAFMSNYKKVNTFLNKFSVKHEFSKLMPYMMNEDTVYTYYRENDSVATLQILPSNFCKIVNKNNIARSYAFDLSVFYNDAYQLTIEDYPEEIQIAYEKYKKGELEGYWYVLDPTKAFAFKFNDWTDVNVSPFMGVFLDALQISEDKALQRTKNVISAKQLIHQRIPMKTDKDSKPNQFLLDLDTAQMFHDTVKNHLEEDGYITVTSPMEMTKVNLDGGANVQADIVRQSETNLWSSIGTAEALFNSIKAGNIGLEKNIKVDENYMFVCYRMFERFMKYILFIQTGRHNFNFIFPDISKFNWETKFKNYIQSAQYGLPTMYLAMSSLGVEMKDVDSMVYFENINDIKSKLRPLVSSFTANTNDLLNQGGAPKKDTSELSDNQINQIDQGTQDSRA